ncbi:MAG TPA: WD40 repeat domain-containing protein [Gemmataceae bacterium]|nr:WD40 repeat domain-containing protein [Gemmataceae bacterium]
MNSKRFVLPLLVAAVGLLACGPLSTGQQPPKAPPFPPVAPALARLDHTMSGLDGPGFAIAAGEESGVVAAACEGGTVQLWHKDALLGIRSGNGTAQVLRGLEGPVTGLAWNGGPVLAAAGGSRILLWALPEGNILHTLTAEKLVRALAMSPDGKLVAGAGDDPTVQLWEVGSGKPTAALREHTDWILCLRFSPGGNLLASGGYDGLVRLWDVAAGKKVRDLPAAPIPPPKVPPDPVIVHSLAFSPDGKELAIGGADGQIRLVSAGDGKVLRTLTGHNSAVMDLAYHPGGKLLASASKDRTVRLWDPTNGQPLKVLEGHAAWVQGVVFWARGTRLASAGADQTVRVWDLTEPPKK